jgi:FG-GAP-like repeat
MASFLVRLRSFAPLLVAWLGFSLPVAPERVEAPPLAEHGIVAAGVAGDASSLISTLSAGRQPVPLHRVAAAGQLRSVDIDADGRPDLVATGRGGLRTFLNVGSGRFVEHSATRTILRRHSAPGFTARERSTHTEVAALVGERQALAPALRTAERATVCTFTLDDTSAPPADGAIVAGGSRAPPSGLS